jgi:DNA-binding NarL/FixJ family response regulator
MNIIIVMDNVLHSINTRVLLEGEPGIHVLDAYSDASEALESLRTFCPDIMVTNVALPGMSGIELIARAKEMWPELEILAYTSRDDHDSIFSALKAGTGGYILTGGKPRELIEALYSLNQGGAPMSPSVARKVVRQFHSASIEKQYLITPREKEILICIDKGLSYKELAEHLDISVHTIHTHITKIFRKLKTSTRREALIKIRKMGLI